MILKYITNKDFNPTVDYLNVPDNTIVHRQYGKDNDECWVLVFDEKYYSKNCKAIFAKGRNYSTIYSVAIDKYKFVFMYNIESYNWPGVSDDVFYGIFADLLYNTYIYEEVFLKDRAKELLSCRGETVEVLTEKVKSLHQLASASRIVGLRGGMFEIHKISKSVNKKNYEIQISNGLVSPHALLMEGWYDSKVYLSHDPSDYNDLLEECFYEFRFDKLRHEDI